MKDIERAKRYQKKLYEALGQNWTEANFKNYWEGHIYGSDWDSLHDKGLLQNNFCAWCGNDELKSDYYRSPNFSVLGVKVPICDECYIDATGGSSKSGCFIATAVLGSYTHPDVILLRHFRDEILLKGFLGKLFVQTYYILSPPIANLIKDNKYLRDVIRKKVISPIVKKVKQKYYKK